MEKSSPRGTAKDVRVTEEQAMTMSPEDQAIELMTSGQRLSGRGEALRLLGELRSIWGHQIANAQRNAHDELRPYFHLGQPCQPTFDCHVSKVIDVADREGAM